MSIRRLFLVVFGLLVLLIGVTFIPTLSAYRTQVTHLRAIGEANVITGAVQRLMSALAAERGLGVLLLSASSGREVLRARLLEARELSDYEYVRFRSLAVPRLENVADPTGLMVYADIARDFAALKALRSAMDEWKVRERPSVDAENWLGQLTLLLEAVRLGGEILANPALPVDRDFARLGLVRSLLGDAAERLGRERAVMSGLIATRMPVPSSRMAELDEGVVLLAANLLRAERLLRLKPLPPALEDALAALKQDASAYLAEMRAGVMEVGASAGGYPVDERTWFAAVTRVIERTHALSVEVGVLQQDFIARQGEQVSRRAMLGLFSLFALGLTLATGVWLFRRSILAPLGLIEAAAARVSRGELDEPLVVSSGNEVGRVARAFEHMRTSLLADMRQREAAEIELRKLSLAVEQSPASIVITDIDANITYANAAFVRNTGYRVEEVVGRNPRLLQSGLTPSQTYASMWSVLAAGGMWEGEFQNRRKDGSLLLERVMVAPIRDGDGRVTNYLAVKEDITEKQRMLEELIEYRERLEGLVAERTAELEAARDAAEVANRAKSEFLAVMSHEIRTPMNGVLGLADVLARSSLSPYQIELVDTIRESGSTLLRIIDDILDFSKIEAGGMSFERHRFAVVPFVEGVADALLPVAERYDVELRVHVATDLPARIIGDEGRVRQILTNLMGNAIKFSSRTGRRGLVELRAAGGPDTSLVLSVADNGIGIAEEARDRLFKPFSQAESSTTRRFGGTGLGLAICKRLVDLLGGRIELETEPGHGSLFRVVLPLEALDDPVAPGRPVLAGVCCAVVGVERGRAADMADYLAAEGAVVLHVAAFAELSRRSAWLDADERVVLAHVIPDHEELEPGAERGKGCGVVVLEHGHRRRPRLRRAGLASLDLDLVRHGALIDAVALALGRIQPQRATVACEHVDSAAPVVPDREEAIAEGTLILVAEDDPINRQVIRRQLALLGFAAEIVPDGAQALERWRSGQHALLLTDLHMPVMDGYQLAAAVRREEGARTGARVPIVALTANALRGEDARCREAGMDDFLTKPVRVDVLRQVLRRWLHSRDEVGRSSFADSPLQEPALPVLERGVLAGLIGEDPQIHAELLRDYELSLVALAAEIHVAHDANALRKLGDCAHRLKSSSRAVGALAMGALCERLERACREGEDARVDALVVAFRSELDELLAALRRPV